MADAPCPEDDAFIGVVTGALEPEVRERLLAHADACADCHAVLADLLRDAKPASDVDTIIGDVRRVPLRPHAGTAIDHYIVIDRIGMGAMGEVLRARDTTLGRDVAIKLLLRPPTADWEERLVREARAMARLSHPNVVAVFGVGHFRPTNAPARSYVAMELVVGTTLRQWCEASPRAWPDVLQVWLAAGDGLAAAHAQGIVHRDFKPDNVLIGDDGRVRVGDFGLAASTGTMSSPPSGDIPVSDPLTRTGELVGTPRYMAPEQLRAATVTEAADQFAFAVSLYHALYGTYPYEGGTLEMLMRSYLDPPTPPPRRTSVPPAIWDALRRALQPEPSARFVDMHELLARLRDVLARRRRRRFLAATAAVGLVGLAGGVAATQAMRDRPCAGLDARWGGAWGDERRAEIEAALDESGRDVLSRVDARLDAFALGWRETAELVCNATHVDGSQSPELLALRLQCLDDQRDQVVALVGVLAHRNDPSVMRHAVPAVEHLPSPTACRTATATPAGKADESEAIRGELRELAALLDLGLLDDAQRLGESLLERASTPWARAHARLTLAHVYLDTSEQARVDSTMREGLLEAAQAGDDDAIARFWLQRLWTSVHNQRVDLAEEQLVAARAATHRAGDPDDLRHELAIAGSKLHLVSGDLELALTEADAALEAATVRDAPLERATALLHHAAVSMQLGRIDDALRDAGDGLALREQELGPTHPATIRARQNLASTLHAANEPQKARDVLAIALEGARRELGEDSSLFATLLSSLVIVDGQLGNHEATVTEGARAIALAERLGQGDDENLIYARVAMAHSFAALGRHDESERTISQAVAQQERLLGPDHPQLALVLIARGEALRERKRCEPALVDFQRALRISPERSRDAAYASMGVGLCRLSAGDRDGARRSLERALELHRELGSDPKDIASTERALADATSG